MQIENPTIEIYENLYAVLNIMFYKLVLSISLLYMNKFIFIIVSISQVQHIFHSI